METLKAMKVVEFFRRIPRLKDLLACQSHARPIRIGARSHTLFFDQLTLAE
jgi:hypothetical protein